MTIKKLLLTLINRLWLAFAALVITVAVLVSLLRAALPFVNEFRGDIESWLSQKLNAQVSIAELSAEWKSQGPRFTFDEVRVQGNQPTDIFVESLQVTFNLWQSLFQLTVATDEFRLVNSSLTLLEDDLRLTDKEDLSVSQAYDGLDFAIDFLLGQNDVTIEDINITLVDDENSRSQLIISQLSIGNFDDMHQLTGRLTQQSEGEINFVFELFSDPRLPDSTMQAYIAANQFDLAHLPFSRNLVSGLLKSGRLSGEAWAFWENGLWKTADMQLNIGPVEFTIADESFVYKNIRSQVSWQAERAGRQFVLTELSAESEQQEVIDLAGLLVSISDDKNPRIDIEYNDIAPGKMNDVWALMIDQEDLQRWFLAANPQLNLDNFSLSLEYLEEQWQLTDGQLDVSGLKLSRTDLSPELPTMSGQVRVNANGFDFYFFAEEGKIDYRPQFEQPIPTSLLELEGRYESIGDDAYLHIDSFLAELQDINLRAQGNLYFHPGSSTEVSLFAELFDSNLQSKSLYFPSTMDAALKEYLLSTISGGQLTNGEFLVQGKLVKDFIKQPDLLFQITANLNNLDYQFLPEYPRLEQLDTRLYFDQNSMIIEATRGYYENIQVNKAVAIINDFAVEEPILTIDIDVTTDRESANNYISRSELSSEIGGLLDDIQPSNLFGVELGIRVPLLDGETTLKGAVSLNENTIFIQPIDLRLDRVTGTVGFTTKRVTESSLKVNALGGLHSVVINKGEKDNISDKDFDSRLYVEAEGNIDVRQSLSWLFSNNQLTVYGDTRHKTYGWICLTECTGISNRFNVESLLEGVDIRYSRPLFKTQDQASPLKVSIETREDNQRVEFNVENMLSGGLTLRDNLSTTGSITIGQPQGVLALNSEQLVIGGKFNQLELDRLIDEVESIVTTFGNEEKEVDTLLEVTSASPENYESPLLALIEVDTLLLDKLPITNVRGEISLENDGTPLINIDSDHLLGRVKIVGSDQISLDLEKCHLTNDVLEGMAESEKVTLDEAIFENGSIEEQRQLRISQAQNFLKSLPKIELTCLSCSVGDYELGEVSGTIEATTIDTTTIETTTNEDSLSLLVTGVINRANLINAPFTFNWEPVEEVTRANIEFMSPRIGNLLRDWGFTVSIRDSNAVGSFELQWPGGLEDFATASLTGSASLNIGQGYIEEVSDARARIFSLFSLQSITRRLALDFKDIYRQGFFYDSIKGSFSINDGVIETKDLQVNGAAANVAIKGNLNLVAETVDQTANVTPKVTSSLPLLAGWAVEPTTGVLVWLLSKIFEPAVDVITQIDYRVVGTWQNPQVIELRKSTREVELTEEQLEAIRQVQSASPETESE